jgi:tRNA(adenine34) deaminase
MHVHVDDVDEQASADRFFMEMALDMARRGAAAGEVPVGALLARGAEVLGAAHNAPLALMDPTAHAEVLALRAGARHERNYRLPGTTLYVTVEPCIMCVGALMQARVERVVFGCVEPKAGALGSVFDVGRDGQGNHRFQVRGGVCADAAGALMRRFFAVRRGA